MQVANRLTGLAKPLILTQPESTKSRGLLTQRTAIMLLVAAGLGVRLVALFAERNLWIDEAMLALNLVERTPQQLLEPLSWNQGAPVGFLLAVKAAIALCGPAEWSLRLVPFLGSVAGLVAFAWAARRLMPGGDGILAVALYSLSPYLVGYAGECKQYAIDATLAVSLLGVSLGLLHGAAGLCRWAALAALGAAAVWFSHPAAFVLGGIGSALFLHAVIEKDRARVLASITTIGCWLASFGLCYFLTLRQLGNNQFLVDYWAGHFLPLPPRSPGEVLWLADHYFSFFTYPGGLGGTEFQAGGLAAALALVGWLAIWRERWPVAVALAGPATLALLASALHLYPFSGRLLLFLVPLAILAVARGAWFIIDALRPAHPVAASIILGLLLVAPTVELYQLVRRPQHSEQLEPVLSSVRAQWQPGDRVYLYYAATPAFHYYTREHPFPPGIVFGTENRKQPTVYRDELLKLRGEARVWIIFSHRHENEEAVIRAHADGLGRCTGEIRETGAAAYLYDFRAAH